MIKKHFNVTFLCLLCLLLGGILFLSWDQAQAQADDPPYSINHPYWLAVDAFVEKVAKTIKDDVDNKEEIIAWAEDIGDRLPEFLDDQIQVMWEMSEQPFGEYSFEPAEKFAEKWSAILSTHPVTDEQFALVKPLIDELFKGLPSLKKMLPGDVPLQNFYEYFGQMEEIYPWYIGPFFHFEPLQKEIQHLRIHEVAREVTVRGIKKVFIISRDTTRRINWQIVFKEIIENDKVKKVSFNAGDPTLLHEAIKQMKRYYEAEMHIEWWEQIAEYMDEKILEAWQKGDFYDFSYYYLYDRTPITNELVHVYHPLLKDPYNKTYKVAEFYPREFIQDEIAIEKKLMDAENKEVITTGLKEVSEARSQEIKKAEKLIEVTEGYAEASEKVFKWWSFGFLAPAYIFVLASVCQKFFVGL